MNVQAIAQEMKAAQDRCVQIEPLTARIPGFDIGAAYEVARLIHEDRIREGASPVGRKIGFTNREMWHAHGVYEPIWAYVYDTTVVHLSGSHGSCRLGASPTRGSSRKSSCTFDQRRRWARKTPQRSLRASTGSLTESRSCSLFPRLEVPSRGHDR